MAVVLFSLSSAPLRIARAGINLWSPLGPEAALVFDITIDPHTPSTVYAVAAFAIFKSLDGARTWRQSSFGIFANAVNCVSIDPTSSSVLYAGTSAAVFKSIDAASTWNIASVGITNLAEVTSIVIDPTNPNIVYAGTIQGVFKSVDGAGSWNPASSGLPGGDVVCLEMDPVNTATLYAGTFGKGVFKTTNGGANWAPSNSGISSSVVGTVRIGGSPAEVYAAADSGLFRSLDGGFSWTLTGLHKLVINRGLIIDPGNASILYATVFPFGVFKSNDRGLTWSETDAGLMGEFTGPLAIDPLKPATLYAGTGGLGVFRSADSGSSWSAANIGLSASSVLVLKVAPSDRNIIYLSSQGAGLFKSADQGANWSYRGPPNSDILSLAVDPLDSGTVYAGVGGGVSRTTDGGSTWTSVSAGLTGSNVLVLTLDPVSPSTIYAGTDQGLSKSTDRGSSWTLLNLGITSPFMSAVAIDPNNQQTVYAASNAQGALFKSGDGGATWTHLAGLNSETVMSLAPDPAVSGAIYAGTMSGRIFKSVDAGVNWAAVFTSSLVASAVVAIAVDPRNLATVYAGSARNQVQRTTDGGASWAPINSGLGGAPVSRLALDPADSSILYAGTSGAGLFQIQLVAIPDFFLSFDSSTVTGQAGSKMPLDVIINRSNGFSGNVTVAPPSAVSGIKVKPATPISSQSSPVTFKLKIGASTPAGSYNLVFTGTDDSNRLRTATLTLVVR